MKYWSVSGDGDVREMTPLLETMLGRAEFDRLNASVADGSVPYALNAGDEGAPLFPELIEDGMIGIDGSRRYRPHSVLTVANLAFANLNGCVLVESDMRNGYCPFSTWIGAELSMSQLSHCVLAGADLSYCDLAECDLTGSDLRGVRAIGTSFANANLQGCDFSGADLTNVNMSGALLANVNLSFARISDIDLFPTRFGAANFFGVTIVYGGRKIRPLDWPGVPPQGSHARFRARLAFIKLARDNRVVRWMIARTNATARVIGVSPS